VKRSSLPCTPSSPILRSSAAVDYVRDGLAKGELAPVIDTTFPLDAIAEAHRYLEAGGQVGKIVITVTPEDGTTS
jgi:NADPH:quinone reductase-like Zn-dependent oxidoreductase